MATLVLVHGTTAGGWVWKDVTPHLQAAGHTVYTPTLTGLGERIHLANREVGLETHITDIVNVLLYEDLTDVVLAGHSYGGIVISGVADRVPERIRHLIYLDAVIAEDGESCLDAAHPDNRAEFEARVREQGDGWLIPISRGPNDLPSKNAPHPWKSWTDPLVLNNPPHNIPCTYVRFTADKQPGSYFEQAMTTSMARVHARGWTVLEADTVHQILPDPLPKAEVILKAVKADF
ncbi:MAG: alpha/beta hydrolase [Caldilineaceae bacterium]|nr:alpha/beta hydrolase [Caldilineaceae bacterium]